MAPWPPGFIITFNGSVTSHCPVAVSTTGTMGCLLRQQQQQEQSLSLPSMLAGRQAGKQELPLPPRPSSRPAQPRPMASRPPPPLQTTQCTPPPTCPALARHAPAPHLNRRKAAAPRPNQLAPSMRALMRVWLPLASLVMMATGVVTW